MVFTMDYAPPAILGQSSGTPREAPGVQECSRTKSWTGPPGARTSHFSSTFLLFSRVLRGGSGKSRTRPREFREASGSPRGAPGSAPGAPQEGAPAGLKIALSNYIFDGFAPFVFPDGRRSVEGLKTKFREVPDEDQEIRGGPRKRTFEPILTARARCSPMCVFSFGFR